jgi:hypothetical protein
MISLSFRHFFFFHKIQINKYLIYLLLFCKDLDVFLMEVCIDPYFIEYIHWVFRYTMVKKSCGYCRRFREFSYSSKIIIFNEFSYSYFFRCRLLKNYHMWFIIVQMKHLSCFFNLVSVIF